jgi:hypothetical protein
MGLFDFNTNDGSDSLWEEDRGFWNNIGNLGTNLVGGVGGGIGGFLLGGPIGAAAGAAGGWSAANQAYDGVEYGVTGSYEQNALVDFGVGGAAAVGLTGGLAANAMGLGATGAAAGGTAAAAGGGATAAAGGGTAAAASGAGGGMLGSAGNFLASQGAGLAVDFLQQGASSLFNNYAAEKQAAQERAEKVAYYERNKAAAAATYDASVDSTALKFIQNDLTVRQQAFDFEMTGRMARSGAVASTGASNLSGVSARETFNDISSQTSKGARRFQQTRKNAADSFYQDIQNLQIARDNQVNTVIDPRQMPVSDDIKGLQKIAPWIEFGVGMLGSVGDAVAQSGNVNDIKQGKKSYGS